MDSQFRVDNWDCEKASKVLHAFAENVNKLYFQKEIAKKTKKKHLQGWVNHIVLDNTFRKTLSRKYSDLGTKEKCFTKVKSFEQYVAYIIKNPDKSESGEILENITSFKDFHLHPTEYYTTYTEEEFVELYNSLPMFHQNGKVKNGDVNGKCKVETFFDKVYERCVNEATTVNLDGDRVIDYTKIPGIYMSSCPKQLDSYLLERNINGITNKLEQEYDNRFNRKLRNQLTEDLRQSKYFQVYF